MTLSLPTAQEICGIITGELALAGGTVYDCFEGNGRLYMRTLLPLEDTVKPDDFVQGGIAVAADDTAIHVHPYLFRQVCRNGLVMPQLAKSQTIARVDLGASSDDIAGVEEELRVALRASAQPSVFSNVTRQFGMTAQIETSSTVFTLLMHSAPRSFMPRGMQTALQAEIIERFLHDGDRSMFGLVNAVTSVARDQRDAEVRWRLEELGGGMLAAKHPRVKPGDSAAEGEPDDLSAEPDFFREEACSAV